jgi:hypothetical protein
LRKGACFEGPESENEKILLPIISIYDHFCWVQEEAGYNCEDEQKGGNGIGII